MPKLARDFCLHNLYNYMSRCRQLAGTGKYEQLSGQKSWWWGVIRNRWVWENRRLDKWILASFWTQRWSKSPLIWPGHLVKLPPMEMSLLGRLETRQSIETLQYSLYQILHRFLSCQTILKGYTYMWGDFWLSHIWWINKYWHALLFWI